MTAIALTDEKRKAWSTNETINTILETSRTPSPSQGPPETCVPCPPTASAYAAADPWPHPHPSPDLRYLSPPYPCLPCSHSAVALHPPQLSPILLLAAVVGLLLAQCYRHSWPSGVFLGIQRHLRRRYLVCLVASGSLAPRLDPPGGRWPSADGHWGREEGVARTVVD